MSATAAFRRAWQLLWSRPADSLCFLLIELALRGMVLSPLLFLAAEEGQYLALLCVPLFFLIVPPARANAAEVYQQALRGGRLLSLRLVICPDWGRKVLRGLRQGLLLLLWGLPFLGVTLWLMYLYSLEGSAGSTDALTLYSPLVSLGGGDAVRGGLYALGIYAALLVPFLFGCAFHSGRRHELALGSARVLKGRRVGLMWCWLLGALTLLPFFAVCAWAAGSALGGLKNLLDRSGSAPALTVSVWPVAAAFVLLFLPAMPLRGLAQAAWVRSRWEGKA